MAAKGPVQRTADPESNKWKARPFVAFSLRLFLTALPFVVALAFSFWARSAFPPEDLNIGKIPWVIGVWTLSMGLLLVVDRLSRRFLPLAALFKLSLIFPNRAPQRFSVALRTGTTRQLERKIADVKENGLSPVEEEGATQLLKLVAALGHHDRLTRGHCERVRAYTDLIAEEMGISEDDRSKLHWAAMLHDVGKLAVPSAILCSTGRPTEEEWVTLQGHTTAGAELAEPLRPWLGEWIDAVRSHHERWDGGGYPDGLAAGSIPLGARIVAVADAYDVMTSKRSYKDPIPQSDARAEIAACSGGQFDPEVARAFLNVGLGRLRLVMGPLSWLTSLPGAGGTGTATVISTAATAVAAPVVLTVSAIAASVPPAVLAATDNDDAVVSTVVEGDSVSAPSTPASDPLTTTSTPTTTTTSPSTSTPQEEPAASPVDPSPTVTTTGPVAADGVPAVSEAPRRPQTPIVDVVSLPPTAPPATQPRTTRGPVTTNRPATAVTPPAAGATTSRPGSPTVTTSTTSTSQPVTTGSPTTTSAPTTSVPTTTATTTTAPATTTTTAAPTTTTPTTTAPTTTTTTAPTTTTTTAPLPPLTISTPAATQWIVGAYDPSIDITASEDVSWAVSGRQDFFTVAEGRDFIRLIPILDAGDLGRTATIVATGTTPDGRTSSTTYSLSVADVGLSPFAGTVQITEYLDLGFLEEWVEITNTGTGNANLNGFVLQDYVPGGTPDAADGDTGNNLSFRHQYGNSPLAAGESELLWLWGVPPTGENGLSSNAFPKLESTGDDLWLLDGDGLIVDYVGWYDAGFSGTNPDEWSGAPPASLGLCPTTPNCRRSADWDTVVRGASWTRQGQNFVEDRTPTPGVH